MSTRWWFTSAVAWPAAIVVACAGAFGAALWQAIIIDPVPAFVVGGGDGVGETQRGGTPVEPVSAVAVSAAPFRSTRTPPTARYQLPGTAVTRRPAQPPPNIELTGTMVYPDGGGAALLRVVGRNAIMLRVGEVIGDMTLRSVTADAATFVRDSGSEFVLRVTEGN